MLQSLEIILYILLMYLSVLIFCLCIRNILNSINSDALFTNLIIGGKDIKKKGIFYHDYKGTKKTEKTAYDEYDDKNLLEEKDKGFIKSVKNIIVDGNNFLYKLYEYKNKTTTQKPNTSEYFETLELSIKILSKEFPKKNIFFVMKDPENDSQKQKIMEYMKCSDMKKCYKKFFNDILKKHPKVKIIIAFGDAKARDDFAALWLSDQLEYKTILLSRDRYSDVNKTNRDIKDVNFVVYGKGAKKYEKLLNKPFAFINNYSRLNLVGYSFGDTKSAFYSKKVNNKSIASDHVFIIKI